MTKRTRFALYERLRQDESVVVSLDLHDASTYMFALDPSTGEILVDKRVMGHYRKVLPSLRSLGGKRRVVVLVEAGPHGYAPYRCFADAGYEVKMIAPSSIPHQGKRQKTDRDDAMNNLTYHLSGVLRYVHIPGVLEESGRDCLRLRAQLVWQITRLKQRVHSLLKRQGLQYDQTKTSWTKKHYAWLEKVELNSFVRVTLDTLLRQIRAVEDDVTKCESALDEYLQQHPAAKRVYSLYMLLPGIGHIGALTLLLEGRDLGRFSHPKGLMCYLGLVPGKHQSGSSDPAMRITKAGNKYLRTVLVAAAKFYRDRRLVYSGKKVEAMPEPLRAFMLKCQDRLCGRYRALMAKGKHSNKARCAVAREMCGFVWEYANRIMDNVSDEYLAKAA